MIAVYAAALVVVGFLVGYQCGKREKARKGQLAIEFIQWLRKKMPLFDKQYVEAWAQFLKERGE